MVYVIRVLAALAVTFPAALWVAARIHPQDKPTAAVAAVLWGGPCYPVTLPPSPAEAVLAPPRVCGRRLSRLELIRAAYDAAEAPMAAYLASVGWPA